MCDNFLNNTQLYISIFPPNSMGQIFTTGLKNRIDWKSIKFIKCANKKWFEKMQI